jgi:hypothetical protein
LREIWEVWMIFRYVLLWALKTWTFSSTQVQRKLPLVRSESIPSEVENIQTYRDSLVSEGPQWSPGSLSHEIWMDLELTICSVGHEVQAVWLWQYVLSPGMCHRNTRSHTHKLVLSIRFGCIWLMLGIKGLYRLRCEYTMKANFYEGT